jgi:hypothetical protein
MMLLILVFLTLILGTAQGHNHQQFNLDDHIHQHKESSPTLAGFLKKGKLSKQETSSSSSFALTNGSPPPTLARQITGAVDTTSSLSTLKAKGTPRMHSYNKQPNTIQDITQDTTNIDVASTSPTTTTTSPTTLSAGKDIIKTTKIPGDVYYFFGTLLDLEYGTCKFGALADDLSKEQDKLLVSVKGYALGVCNPYESSAGKAAILTATVNIFLETMILHEITWQYPNCTGANVTTHTDFAGPKTCLGDSKLFVTTSLTLHELFPRLEDKLYVLRTTEACDVRTNLLHFALHNTSYTYFSSDMCWNYDEYTVSIQEGGVFDPMLHTTIVTKEFEPFDDKKCRREPVSIEGWVLDRCEPLTEHTGVKAVWTSVGAKDGTFYIGIQGYDTYDCDRNQSMTGISVLDMGLPNTCYHNIPVPWTIHENALAHWSDYSRDSHSELYGGQVCNTDHIFMWKTAETECSKDTKTDF